IRAHDKFKFLRFKLHLALLPVTFGGLYVGIHSAGLVGAVIALVTIQTLEVAIVVTAIGRHLSFVANDFHHLIPALKASLAAVAASLAAFAAKLPLQRAHPLITIAVCGAIFTLAYVPAAFLLGALTNSE